MPDLFDLRILMEALFGLALVAVTWLVAARRAEIRRRLQLLRGYQYLFALDQLRGELTTDDLVVAFDPTRAAERRPVLEAWRRQRAAEAVDSHHMA